MKHLLLCLLALLACTQALADEVEDVKTEINRIKKSSLYIYAEATAATEQEAHDLAEEMLYQEINAWVAKKKKMQGSKNLVINNVQSLWSTLTLPRGNMLRSFLYVKKSDVIPSDNSVVIPVQPAATDAPSTVETIPSASSAHAKAVYPECVATLAKCTEYADFTAKLQQMRADGRVKSYARYAKLDNPDVCYLAIYNTAGKIVAILSPGANRKNVATGGDDAVKNYQGCGAIGFVVD